MSSAVRARRSRTRVREHTPAMPKSNTEAVDRGLGLQERRAFMRLPLEERRRQMAEQAAQMAGHYKSRRQIAEREGWQGGDIVKPC